TALVARHESLRTRFGSEHGVPYQVIDPPAPVVLPVTDLSGLPAGDRARRELELIEECVRQPYDLERGPLLRLRLLRLAPAEHALLLSASHLVVDGWSVQTVVGEL